MKTRNLSLQERTVLYKRVASLRKSGLGPKEIAKTLRIPLRTVGSWIYDNKRPWTIYTIFKAKPTPELAYVIGVMIGDGHITKYKYRYTIGLRVKDKDFAEKFAWCLTKVLNKRKPCKVFSDAKKFYRTEISCRLLYEFLKRETEKKLVIEAFPTDFIRGLADSEGSTRISIYKKRGHYYFEVKLMAVSNQDNGLLLYVQALLKNHFGIKSNIGIKKKGGSTYFIGGQYVTRNKNVYGLNVDNFRDVKKFARLIQ